MTSAIGYGFLRQKPEQEEVKEIPVEQKGLESLKRMMCPLSMGRVEKCKDCKGIATCSVGQRINVILAQNGKTVKELEAKLIATGPRKPDADREKFREACESGNAWGYMITHGYSKGAAKEKLIYWSKRYPAISQEFGGDKRILAKPRPVIVQETLQGNDEPGEPQPIRKVETETAPAAAEERTEKQGENLSGPEVSAAKRVQKARARCMQAVQSGDALKYIMTVEGKDRHHALQTISNWRSRYPDLMQGIPYQENGRKTAAKQPPKQQEEQTDVQQPEAAQIGDLGPQNEGQTEAEDQEGDEISLEDFLRQYGQTEEAMPETDSLEDLAETFGVVEEPEPQRPEGNPMQEVARLMAQEAEILHKIASLQQQARQLRQARQELEKTLDW